MEIAVVSVNDTKLEKMVSDGNKESDETASDPASHSHPVLWRRFRSRSHSRDFLGSAFAARIISRSPWSMWHGRHPAGAIPVGTRRYDCRPPPITLIFILCC
ncbi:MAG: hypothetical protein ACLRPV_01860 [Lacrimispora saccharolytica]